MNIQRLFIFAVVFLILGLLAHQLDGALRMASPQPASTASTAPAQPLTVEPSKVWPDGATPTKVVHISDTQISGSGLLKVTLRKGEDLEIQFDPLWYTRLPKAGDWLPGTEVMVDQGNGFETLSDYRQKIKQSDSDGIPDKPRTFRLRTAPTFDQTSFVLPILKGRRPAMLHPAVSGYLEVTYEGMHAISEQDTEVTINFHNTGSADGIAIAVYDDGGYALPHPVRCALIAPDGTKYPADTSGLDGIKATRIDPRNLTVIPPGGNLKARFRFKSTTGLFNSPNPFKFWATLAINPYWRAGISDRYQLTGMEDRPPYCGIIEVTFNIPGE